MAYGKEKIKSSTCHYLSLAPFLQCPLIPVQPAFSLPVLVHLHSPEGDGPGHGSWPPACLPLIRLPRLGPTVHAFCASWQKFSVRDNSGETGQPLQQGYPSASEENRIQQPSPLLLADGSALAESPESLQLA